MVDFVVFIYYLRLLEIEIAKYSKQYVEKSLAGVINNNNNNIQKYVRSWITKNNKIFSKINKNLITVNMVEDRYFIIRAIKRYII